MYWLVDMNFYVCCQFCSESSSPVLRSYALVCEEHIVATLRTFWVEYYLWRSDWLRLLGWWPGSQKWSKYTHFWRPVKPSWLCRSKAEKRDAVCKHRNRVSNLIYFRLSNRAAEVKKRDSACEWVIQYLTASKTVQVVRNTMYKPKKYSEHNFKTFKNKNKQKPNKSSVSELKTRISSIVMYNFRNVWLCLQEIRESLPGLNEYHQSTNPTQCPWHKSHCFKRTAVSLAQVTLFQEDRSVHGTSHIVSRGPQCPWHKSICFKRTAVSLARITLFQEDRSVHGTSHIVSRGPQCPWHKSHCFKRTEGKHNWMSQESRFFAKQNSWQ